MKVRGVVTALTLFGVAFVGLVPSAQAACSRTGAQVVDKKGDATNYGSAEGAFPNEPTLDILSGRIKYDKAKKGVIFSIKVADLVDAPPSLATGKWFTFAFTYGGVAYELLGISDDVQGTKQFSIRLEGELQSLSDLRGRMDAKANEVRIEMPFSSFRGASGKTMGLKSKITKLSVDAARNYFIGQQDIGWVSFSQGADEATSKCSYSVGQER